MSCDKEYISFVCSQIECAGMVRTRQMFGEYMIYIDEKPVILVCDDICYVKMIDEIKEMMTEAQTGHPYPGARLHYILDVEHGDTALPVLKKLVEALPYPKKRRKTKA